MHELFTSVKASHKTIPETYERLGVPTMTLNHYCQEDYIAILRSKGTPTTPKIFEE